ncbi:MAG: TonB-dependent receptor [Crocinitomicaceae bacterium]|nr:TonB-dependent receptor [Crocinitomicaceae bacterium]
MKTSILFTIFSFLFFSHSIVGQYTYSGKVTDEKGEPIPYAKIYGNKNKGTVCNEKGIFEFKSNSPGITITAIGYEEQRHIYYPTSQKTELIIKLKRQVQNLETVHVIATRPQIIPSSAILISKKGDLEKDNFGQDLPILLQNTPSVVTTSDAGAGVGYTGIRIRGVDGERINVTINGIPVNDPESHGVWWVNMPDLIGSTDNILVQRGVGTSSNGAASFGASINVKTDNIREKSYAEIDNSVGSFNTWKSGVKAGTGLINNKFSMDVRLSRILSDGYIDRASSNLKSFYLSGSYVGEKSLVKAIAFSGKERTYQSWYGTPESRLFGNGEEMNAYADRNYLSDSERENLLSGGRTYNYYEYENEVDNYQQDNYQLHFTHAFSSKATLNIAGHYTKGRGYYEQYKYDQSLSEYGLNDIVSSSDTITSTDLIRRRWLDNDFIGGVYSLSYKINANLDLTVGGAINTYIGNHYGEIIWARNASNSEAYDKYYDNNAQKTEASSYLKVNYTKNKWAVYGDLQYRVVNYNFGGFDDVSGDLIDIDQQEVYVFLNPKIGTSYSPNENNTLFLSAGISQREPVRKDFRESSVNSRPKHEILRDLELGHSLITDKLNLSSNIYYMNYIDQLINTGKINDVGSYTRVNVDNSYRAGIEISAMYRVIKSLSLNGSVALSQNKIASFTEYIDNYDDPNYEQTQIVHENTDMALSPNLVGNIGFSYEPIKNLSFNWMSKYVGEQFLDNTSNKDNYNRKIDAFSYTNLSLNYTLNDVLFKSMTFGVQCNNVFNTLYSNNGYTWGYIAGGQRTVENFYYPQAGRNFMARLLIEF